MRMTGIIFPHNGLIKKKAAAGGGGFTDPSSLTNSLWLDFTDATGITSDGSTQITNTGGVQDIAWKGSDNTKIATYGKPTQSNASNKPVWNSAGYIDCTSANMGLKMANAMYGGLLNTAGAWSCWMTVCKDISSGNGGIMGEAEALFTQFAIMGVHPFSSAINDQGYSSAGSFLNDSSPTGFWIDDTWQVIGFICDGSTIKRYNGSTLFDTSASYSISGTYSMVNWTLNGRHETTNTNFTMKSGSLCKYNHVVLVDYDISAQGSEMSDLATWMASEISGL